MNENDGGAAFARHYSEKWPDGSYEAQSGMTLRDYFAASAMQALIGADLEARQNPDKAAHWAYQNADAMLKERS